LKPHKPDDELLFGELGLRKNFIFKLEEKRKGGLDNIYKETCDIFKNYNGGNLTIWVGKDPVDSEYLIFKCEITNYLQSRDACCDISFTSMYMSGTRCTKKDFVRYCVWNFTQTSSRWRVIGYYGGEIYNDICYCILRCLLMDTSLTLHPELMIINPFPIDINHFRIETNNEINKK
jgi:hypothetical protein